MNFRNKQLELAQHNVTEETESDSTSASTVSSLWPGGTKSEESLKPNGPLTF